VVVVGSGLTAVSGPDERAVLVVLQRFTVRGCGSWALAVFVVLRRFDDVAACNCRSFWSVSGCDILR
jgi:hypothetical protein